MDNYSFAAPLPSTYTLCQPSFLPSAFLRLPSA